MTAARVTAPSAPSALRIPHQYAQARRSRSCNLEDIRRVLLETATGANRQLWATINCKHCGRAVRYEITVPDNKVRLDAIQALLHESLGRSGQAEAQPAPALPATAAQAREERRTLREAAGEPELA